MAKLFWKRSVAGDAFDLPAFTLQDRLKRLLWAAVYFSLFRFSPVPLFTWRSLLLKLFGAKVGQNLYVYPSARIWAPWLLDIQDFATVGPRAEIYNPGGVFLGHHSIVSQDAFVCGGTHDFNSPLFPMTWKPIVLEPYSWICARAVVLPGVKLGHGAVLGAAAVAAKELEPLGIYVGNPARKVGRRSAAGAHLTTEISVPTS